MLKEDMTFPYVEIKRFDTPHDALKKGFASNQIWSVCECDETGDWIYGPPHHYVNRAFVITTKETHDHDTYYIENFSEEN